LQLAVTTFFIADLLWWHGKESSQCLANLNWIHVSTVNKTRPSVQFAKACPTSNAKSCTSHPADSTFISRQGAAHWQIEVSTNIHNLSAEISLDRP